MIGNVTRNAVIGRSMRLGLSGKNIKIKNKESVYSKNYNSNNIQGFTKSGIICQRYSV